MPSKVTLVSVKIASSREVAMEAAMTREVIADWNAAHACAEALVLLPLTEPAAETGPCDLLVAFLHAAQGAPLVLEADALEAEIEWYLEQGRPVLLYFSEARVAFARTGETCARTLQDCKNRYASRAVIDSFNDEKEFRARFARQLDTTLRSHSAFGLVGAETGTVIQPDRPQPPPPELSERARQLLIEACQDPEAYVGRYREGAVLKLQANGRQMVEQDQPESVAAWDAAFHELIEAGHLRDAGCHGRLFQITPQGFAYLKTLGHTPVGYIAELGSV